MAEASGSKGRQRGGDGEASQPARVRVWGSAVSSPSGVRDRARPLKGFLVFYRHQRTCLETC